MKYVGYVNNNIPYSTTASLNTHHTKLSLIILLQHIFIHNMVHTTEVHTYFDHHAHQHIQQYSHTILFTLTFWEHLENG